MWSEAWKVLEAPLLGLLAWMIVAVFLTLIWAALASLEKRRMARHDSRRCPKCSPRVLP